MMATAIPERGGLAYAEIDALVEVANIGAGNAPKALYALTSQPFNMSVPSAGIEGMATFWRAIGGSETLTVAVYLPVEGGAPGHGAFLLPHDSACRLADLLLQQPSGTTEELDARERSALVEAGNILVSSLLSALADLTGLRFRAAPPGIAIDMIGAITQPLAAVSPSLGDHAVTIITRLADQRPPTEGAVIHIPEPCALDVLFDRLGIAS